MRILAPALVLALSLLLTAPPVSADGADAKREMALEYLQFLGYVESIDLAVETMRMEYEEYYTYLPNTFWEHPDVVEAFNSYKVALLRGYVETLVRDLPDSDLEFLVDFYATEDGRRVAALDRQLNPMMVAAGAEAGREFATVFTYLMENGTD